MTTLQEYLDQKYPTLEAKKEAKEIDIQEINRERKKRGFSEYVEGKELDLRGYHNLEKIIIDGRYLKTPLTRLEVSNCSQLVTIDCYNNQLINLDLTNCINLKRLGCWNNLLTNLDLVDCSQLEELWISGNNFSEQNSSFCSHLVNLKGLSLGNDSQESVEKRIYNRFCGSLEPLKNLTKLERLFIHGTDINSGLEHLPKGIKEFRCSSNQRPEAKVKKIERELKRFGEPNNYNFAKLLKDWKFWKKEFIDSPAQRWLEENYPKEGECQRETTTEGWDGTYGWDNGYKKMEMIIKLDISQQELKGGLRFKGFTNLERLNCSENQITNLDLRDCPKLVELKCDQNSLRDLILLQSVGKLKALWIQNNLNIFQDLKIFIPFKELTHLDISNCPFEGSLKPLENLNKLERLNISNTNLKEGLEYLPESCKKLYCDSNYPKQSTKIMEELDKSKCLVERKEENNYYNLDKWRIDQANNKTTSVVPLERLFVIRGNLKQFLNKWGKNLENSTSNELNNLQSPEQYSKFRYLGGVKWIARGAAATGGILALTNNEIVGGALAAASPFIDAFASHIEENYYQKREEKWKEFLSDADMFLDNYHELLGIIKGIKANELGEVNQSFKVLKEKANDLLDEYDQPDESGERNGEIDLEELISRRKDLADDLAKDKKASKLWEIVNTMKELEKKVTDYRQGIDPEETKKPEVIDNSHKDNVIIDLEEELNNQPLSSSQANLLDKSKQKEEVEMQKMEAKIVQKEPLGISGSSK